jgi:thymidylate synthase
MQKYHTLVRRVLQHGKRKGDPQKVGNIAVLAHLSRYDVRKGFPLITTRSLKSSFKAAVIELLWFLSGESRVDFLHKHGVHLWDQWATPEICAMHGLEPGDLGRIYGPQWRHWRTTTGGEIDQIQTVVNDLNRNPDSRRLVVTAWNPEDVDNVFVAPCHCLFKFFHAEGQLDLHLWQRSADVPIGVPFNIAEYALLLMMMAQVTGLTAGELVHDTSDTHIYNNQIDQMHELLTRSPRKLPTVSINPDVKDIFSFRFEDFELKNYNPHSPIKIPVAT